jgi:hypothetical protein
MKKILIIILPAIVLAIAAVYFYEYEIIESIKKRLRDRVTLQVNSDRVPELGFFVGTEYSDYDTLVYMPLKSTELKLPRVYGKNDFSLIADGKTFILDASYFKMDVWKQADIDIQVTTEGDSVYVAWRRAYNGATASGRQAFFF